MWRRSYKPLRRPLRNVGRTRKKRLEKRAIVVDLPTKKTILAAINLFNDIKEQAFIDRFATGHKPREFYLQYKGTSIPLKALWAAAHSPPKTTGPFSTNQAKAGFVKLGFEDWGQNNNPKNDALRDMDSEQVDTRISATITYVRNPRVRAAVMLRAGGTCEYCGDQGFTDLGGIPYLECHHIVHLAKDGKDKRTNVIALCPNHHREAHLGKNRVSLEQDMTRIVAQKEALKQASDRPTTASGSP